MCRSLKNYFKNLEGVNPATRSAMIGVFVLLVLLLAFVVIAQLITIKQLDKITGTIINADEELTSYDSGNKGKGKPNYSLIITLDNRKKYDVELDDSNWGIQNTDYKGQKAVIYTPTIVYNILSLDFIDFGTRVSQFEVNGKVLYSFDNHKRKELPAVGYLLAFLLLYIYQLYRWPKYDMA